MTLPSQFSLEEENFYKDIQDLVKNGSQNEKELSFFLQRYMDLLSRADLDDETFIINFTKAGLIIEASAKVYGTKVDKLWVNLEHVMESLKNKSHGQSKKKSDCEDGDEMDMDGACEDEEGKRKLPHSRRRKKLGEALFSVDDFLEIDSMSGLLGKNMNESSNRNENKLKLCEKVPNIFIKNKTKKKRIDVCLNKCTDDKDVIRLRDWVLSESGLLVKEVYAPLPESTNCVEEAEKAHQIEETTDCDHSGVFERLEFESVEEAVKASESLKNERNNNTEVRVDLKETTGGEKMLSPEGNKFITELNISRESDVAKFPNVLDRLSEECLVDVDEVFWNASKFQDVIPSKKMRAGKTNKPPCQLCADKKGHKKRGKRCLEEKRLESLDSYFTPHVQPSVPEPQFGILPDEDLYSVFKIEMKLIEQLGKVNSCKNINEAYNPKESPEELRNFLGFDGFENRLMKRTTELEEDEMMEENLRLDPAEEDNDNYVDDPPPDNEFELPFPVTETSVKCSIIRDNDTEHKENELLANSELEYQKLVIEELKDHYAAKTSFAKNKELGMKISKWHEMIADKIELSQKRGALNMNSLAGKIMNAFPPAVDGGRPKMAFKDLVRRQSRRDVPKYFFACLQLVMSQITTPSHFTSHQTPKFSTWKNIFHCMGAGQLSARQPQFVTMPHLRQSPDFMLNKVLIDADQPVVEVRRQAEVLHPLPVEMTNEGNLDICKSDPQPLVTDCMIIERLRPTRANCELDEGAIKSPSKDMNFSKSLAQINKKRNSILSSPPALENKNLSKSKRAKQKIVRSHKRPKNFNSINNSKRRRCSISSADSFLSD